MTKIIGISAHYHDSAAALLVDGDVVAAAQEERFTRQKHDPDIPMQSIRYCLDKVGLTLSDIDRVAYYEDPIKKLGRNIWMGLPEMPMSHPKALFKFNPMVANKEIRDLIGFEGPIDFHDHHYSHAASTYFFSGFDDAAILVVDGVGEWNTITMFSATGNNLKLIGAVDFPHSIGLFYSTITSYLGFEVNDGEYKVMGLAPYGSNKYVKELFYLVNNYSGNKFELEMSYFDFLKNDQMYSEKLFELLGRPARTKESKIDQFHKDIAKSLQTVLETILLEKVDYLYSKAPSENLCMAGGVALNCVANGEIHKKGPYNNLFIQPASSDSGSAMGAAALSHIKMSPDQPISKMTHVYLGPNYSNTEVNKSLGTISSGFTNYGSNPDALNEIAADFLADGKVIGFFQGQMEFGPRSLGNRSILADPRHPGMRNKINAFVKKREGFRPFAPAVMEDKARQHFDLDYPSSYMLETCKVISDLDLPAITHVDGSARVQTVNREQNEKFYKLLEKFDEKTGCPILLNTSFNLRGEPVVCTPLEAILCFVRSDIDVLIIENHILERKNILKEWLDWFRKSDPKKFEGVSNVVYTFL